MAVVQGTDTRKPLIIDAFKSITGCNKVTLVKELKRGVDGKKNVFQAHCLLGNRKGYKSLGHWEVQLSDSLTLVVNSRRIDGK